MTKPRNPNPHPEAALPAWIRELPDDERADLTRTWHLAAWAREGEVPDVSGTEAAFERLQSTLGLPSRGPQVDHREPSPKRLHRVLWPVALAGFMVFVGAMGFWLYSRGGEPGAISEGRIEFIVLVRGGTFAERPLEEQQEIVAAFTAWAGELAAEDRLVAGEQLAGQGRVLGVHEGEVVEQAVGEEENAVGGFFIITAADYEEAVAIARECPQLDYGGTVEVRQIIRQ